MKSRTIIVVGNNDRAWTITIGVQIVATISTEFVPIIGSTKFTLIVIVFVIVLMV